MKRGCLQNFVFAALLVLIFGASTFFSFTFFIKGRSLPTPNLIGRSVGDARRITQDLGVTLVVDEAHRRNHDKVPLGHIVWQNRDAGAASFIKRGTTVRVELSAGPLVLRVPDLNAQSLGTAMLRLGQQNLRVGAQSYLELSGKGILAADPAAGTVVAAQTPVSLLIAVPSGSPEYVMPDLIDRPLDQVRPSLEARGLNISAVKFEAYPGIVDGIIIRQYPLQGAPVSSGNPITVVVSRREETSIIEQAAPPAPSTTP